MADVLEKTIGELEPASQLDDTSLIPIEQSGIAKSITGRQLRTFAEQAAGSGGGSSLSQDDIEAMKAEITAAVMSTVGEGGSVDTRYVAAMAAIQDIVREKTGIIINIVNLDQTASMVGDAIDTAAEGGNLDDENYTIVTYGSSSIGLANIKRVAIGRVAADRVLTIAADAFKDKTTLRSVSMPDNLYTIGSAAFRNTGLASVTIPASVAIIDQNAFYACTSLASVVLSSGGDRMQINQAAFYGCTALASISVPDSVVFYGINIFLGCTALEALTIPANTLAIPNALCSGCTSLVTVTIRSSLTSIGNNAFLNCANLENINLPASLTSIGSSAFNGCAKLDISLASNVNLQTIAASAFYGCTGLRSMTIPSGVSVIGSSAFEGCRSLTTVVIQGATTISSDCFKNCVELSSLTIPNSVTSMGGSSWTSLSGCTMLLTVGPAGGNYNIKIGWTASIPNYSFRALTFIQSVVIPDGVTSIGVGAFAGCTGLQTVYIPASVETISQDAFNGCTNLYNLTIAGSPTIGTNAFKNVPGYSG